MKQKKKKEKGSAVRSGGVDRTKSQSSLLCGLLCVRVCVRLYLHMCACVHACKGNIMRVNVCVHAHM